MGGRREGRASVARGWSGAIGGSAGAIGGRSGASGPWAALVLVAAAVAGAASQSDLAAQEVGLEETLRLASSYEARGKTYHEGPAAQLTADAVATWGRGEVRAGVWANAELWRADRGPTMLAGAAPGLSEVNLYVSAAREAGPLTVTGGWIYFLWPTGFDFSDASPVHELFVGASAPLPGAAGRAGVTASAAAYYDFSARGTYAVASVGAPLPRAWRVRPELAVEVAGVVGQEEYYARADGLTHVGVALSTAVQGRWTTIRPELRWTIGLDEATRVGSLRDGGRSKLHVGVSFSR